MNYLIYDDQCNFCLTVLKKVKPKVKNDQIIYIARSSDEGKKIIYKYKLSNINSIIYIQNDNILIKSKAIIKIFASMKFPYYLLFVFNILPSKILDLVYDFIAKRRHKIL